MKEHKERRRLVQLAAMMSDDDYEHAGPVDKTAEEIADAQAHRECLQDLMDSLKTEISAHLDFRSHNGASVPSGAVILVSWCWLSIV